MLHSYRPVVVLEALSAKWSVHTSRTRGCPAWHSLFHATFPWIVGELLCGQCFAEHELSDSYLVINSKFTWPGGSAAGICLKRHGSLATQLCQVGTPWNTWFFHKFFRKRFAMAGPTGLFCLPVLGASPSCQVQMLWRENLVGHSGWLILRWY